MKLRISSKLSIVLIVTLLGRLKNPITKLFEIVFSSTLVLLLLIAQIFSKQEKLGSMLDKMTRMEAIVVNLSLAIGISQDLIQIILEAASLAMSDLATAVVTEFTSLAGIMGRHYALREGFSEEVLGVIHFISS